MRPREFSTSLRKQQPATAISPSLDPLCAGHSADPWKRELLTRAARGLDGLASPDVGFEMILEFNVTNISRWEFR